MEISTMLHNSGLNSARQHLAENPKALSMAALMFRGASGTDEERMLFALDAALVSLKQEVEPLLLPDNMEEMTAVALREFAKANNISYNCSDKKSEIISKISWEASQRKFFS